DGVESVKSCVINYETKMAPQNDNVSKKNTSKKCSIYICSSCDTKFKSKVRLRYHLRNCSSIKKEPVSEQDSGSKSSNESLSKEKESKLLVASKKRLKCTKCPKVFTFEKSFLKHIANEHSNFKSKIQCIYCDITLPNTSSLKVHIDNKHHSREYECKYCRKRFARKYHICTATFTRKDNLIVHLREQHLTNRNSFFCKICNYYSKNISKLILHNQRMHLPKPLQLECDHCGKITSSKATMLKHLEIHGDKKYVCMVCGYKTYTVEVMRRHTYTHIDNKPNKCDICDKSYIQRGQLLKHLKKHEGFFCTYCKEQFNTKPAYRHVSTHTLDRPRRCMYCAQARAYVRGEHLLRHGTQSSTDRVSKSELEAILNMLDAESDRILEDLGTGVMYAGLQEERSEEYVVEVPLKTEPSPLMSEPVLVEKLKLLLNNLIEIKLLEEFGWPDASIDEAEREYQTSVPVCDRRLDCRQDVGDTHH
ncbi:unnamed protein product, partial [Leptidea sinapis]